MRYEHRKMTYRPPFEERGKARGSLRLYWRFVKEYLLPYRARLTLCIALLSLNACSVYLMAYYGRVVVDRILVVTPPVASQRADRTEARRVGVNDRTHAARRLPARGKISEKAQSARAFRRPPGAAGRLMGIFALYLLTVLLLNIAARWATSLRITISKNVTRQLRDNLHKKVLSLSSSFHQAHPPGRLMARILSDVEIVQQNMMTTVVAASSDLIMFLVGMTIVLFLEWRVAAVVFVVMLLYSFVVRKARTRMGVVSIEIRHTNACLWGLVSQKLDSIRAVLAYGRERHERLNFHRLSSCLLRD